MMNGRSRHRIKLLLSIVALGSGTILATSIFRANTPNPDRHGSLSTNQGSLIARKTVNKSVAPEPVLPPVIKRITASPATLWPPDKRMVDVSLEVVAARMTEWKIVGVESNEPSEVIGDGDSGPDAAFVGKRLKLRAERDATGSGRRYTIYLRASNRCESGLEASAISTVYVSVPGNLDEPWSGTGRSQQRESLSQAGFLAMVSTSRSRSHSSVESPKPNEKHPETPEPRKICDSGAAPVSQAASLIQ